MFIGVKFQVLGQNLPLPFGEKVGVKGKLPSHRT